MSLIKKIATAVLALSFLTFVALFGRLPAFRYDNIGLFKESLLNHYRKTPIGFLNRLLWIHLPNTLTNTDRRITGGRLTSSLAYTGNYLLNEKHPLVLVRHSPLARLSYDNTPIQGFFLVLLSGSEVVFIPPAWPQLSLVHRWFLPLIVSLPYFLTYATVTSSSSNITPENHRANMLHYPYDWALFFPGHVCRTCRFLKPARSKHCSICKACVAKHDHHCVWVNNCLGRGNYGYFVALLFSLSILLTYGVYLGHMILTKTLQETTLRRSQGMASRSHWSVGKDWSTYFQLWTSAFAEDIRIGSVTLLAFMTAPLALGLFLYHVYLVWAGMTTNESHKWADWRDDIADGIVFKGRRRSRAAGERSADPETEPEVAWPLVHDQILVRGENGWPPSSEASDQRAAIPLSIASDLVNDENSWVKVRNLGEVHNIYDLGFWDNFRDILRTR